MYALAVVVLPLQDILLSVFRRYYRCFFLVILLLSLLGICLQAVAGVKSQRMTNKRITLALQNETLRGALTKVEQLSGFRIAYPPEEVRRYGGISIPKATRTVQETLSLLLSGTPLSFKQKEEIIIIYKPVAGGNITDSVMEMKVQQVQVPSRSIIGSVIEFRTNTPLPGVSVQVKGTSRGTQTQADGTFSIQVPPGATALTFSYIGYETKEVELGSSNQVNIALNPANIGLKDVVIVAYGEQKKATVTGAIASISTKELVQSPVSNLSNALAGRLPGLITTQRSGEPGVDASTFYIRGVSTLNNATPIIMVDGVERSMDYLDPNDIESLTILKDAAATAVLGMRGANGAVLITTKRGKAGAPQVSFRASMGLQEATRLPKYLGSYDYARLYNEALANDGSQPAFSPQQLEGFKNGTLPNTDYYKYMMRPSMVAQGNLNVSGGGNIARYFISAGYNMAEGNYRYTNTNKEGYNGNNRMKRYNLRANVDVDITPTLTARLDLAGTLTDRTDGNNSAGDIMNLANRLPPIFPILNPDGSMWGNGTYTQNIYGELSQKGYRRFYNNTVQGTFALTRKLDFITKNLSVKASFSYDNTNTPSASYSRGYAVFEPLYNNGAITGYKQYGQDTKIDPNGSFNGGNALRNTYLETTANWNRRFGNHEASGLLLWNRRLQEDGSKIPFAYQSILFRGTYNYKSKYLLEISASYQGSENFPKESRYGLFPSVSGGWVLSEEPFMKDHVKVISFLKLRASYGEVGNDRSGGDRFLWFTSWSGADPYFFGTNPSQANGWAQGAIGNPNVTWERGRQVNAGLEARFFKDKLGVTLDLFRQRRSDILISRSTLSDVFGQNIKAQNIGVVDSKGFELELTHDNTIGKVHYFIKPNITYAKNNIVYQDEVARAYPWMRRTGHPVGTKFGLIAEGLFKDAADVANSPVQSFSAYGPGDLKYRKLTGKEYDRIQESFDETAIGYARTPEIMYGASLGVDYKGVDITVLFQGAGHSDVLLNNEAVYEFFQGGKVKPFHEGRWTPETAATATYPRLHATTNGNNHRSSSFWIRSADYLRIKNAEIGWQLPKRWIAPLQLSYFRVYINGMNLYTWDKLKDFQVDPEIGDGNGAMYPIQKIWNFGIDVRF
ncbi:TonB-dependent receptor [Chitinophaga pendula]|uniref:SusC/RagA family TonB-linked outer membrane protein n=1 Tax=Chitinophaga TaxID=79328 RepID=UPI000BB054D8|nr:MULTISPECIES: TonB-dependent receptor [Chitinophaga]ASZ13362.1 SusC/RagA family TonB-linked outer membrane protein [Chitinophaga sp. MD30]UCJ09016.1 TonB-dependent receptor [Chitinophaga pendula]